MSVLTTSVKQRQSFEIWNYFAICTDRLLFLMALDFTRVMFEYR